MIMVLAPHKKKSEARAEVKAEKARVAEKRAAERAAEKADRAPQERTPKPRRRSENLDVDV
jgi:translation initiation factor IF-3